MQANNLTISIPNKGCDKNCPYCVSRMTGYVESNEKLFEKNLPIVRKVSESAGISSVLVTGKGEPFLNVESINKISEVFNEYPLEIQTNGIKLYKDFQSIKNNLNDQGHVQKSEKLISLIDKFNVICFSIDSLKQFHQYGEMFSYLAGSGGPIIRVTLNISSLLGEPSFNELISLCQQYDVRQFSLRKLSIPQNSKLDTDEKKETAQWIEEHGDDSLYDKLVREMMIGSPIMLRVLPFGAVVYDADGISVTHFEYCIQDDNDTENTRSLIYQEDGHLYDNWWSRASILF